MIAARIGQHVARGILTTMFGGSSSTAFSRLAMP